MRRAMNCLTLTDPVAIAPGTDLMTRYWPHEIRSLPLPVLTTLVRNFHYLIRMR